MQLRCEAHFGPEKLRTREEMAPSLLLPAKAVLRATLDSFLLVPKKGVRGGFLRIEREL